MNSTSAISGGSVSDTAFLVCESRARNVELSRDVHARDWIAPKQRSRVRALWEAWSSEVYPHDALEVSLRHRYWLERLDEFVARADKPVFANVGGGLTSYPFLLAESVRTVEFDRATIVDYKRQRMSQLQRSKVIPKRDVTHHPVELDSETGLERLETTLKRTCSECPSFILCEGLVYYLKRSSLDRLMEIFRSVQSKGSILGVDFWPRDVAGSPVFHRMAAFFTERFEMPRDGYTFVDEKWVTSRSGYHPLDITDVVEQEKVFSHTEHLEDPSQTLVETYAMLERT